IAVIFFGGNGVMVVGDNGLPTAAYRTLQNQLLKDWPKPEGFTPMDEAFEQVVRITSGLPKGTEVTALLFTDGQPDSGRLRHEAAGGKPDDLVLAHPTVTAFAKLHARGLTALPNILVRKPLQFAPDPNAFERTYPIKLDQVGNRTLITLVFEPGIADFEKQAT